LGRQKTNGINPRSAIRQQQQQQPERNMPFGRLSTDKTTLKWILWKYNRREWTGLIWLRMKMSGGTLLNWY
jgi:hypothetical protein